MKKNVISLILRRSSSFVVMAALFTFGSHAGQAEEGGKSTVAASAPIRINVGAADKFTDASGNVWQADQGFVDGETVDRGEIVIANAKDQAMYRTERYGMTAFSQPVANGKYTVKLHFAETYEEITAAGQRVFSVNVEGKEIKDLDVFAKAGGARKAHVETVNVEVADGKLDIAFTSQIDNAEINGIEIIPAALAISAR